MAKRVGLDGLSDAIAEILGRYADGVTRDVNDCVRQTAKAGVKALRETSPVRTGKYAKGWAAQFENGRLGTTATIYNGDYPGLVHLLEHGHVGRNGTGWQGFVPAHVHVAPVEAQLIEAFRDRIKVVIER